MCMLIWHPKGAEPFTRAEFEDFHQRNPHGFGAVWVEADGQLRYSKGLATVDESWARYRELLDRSTGELLLHWRLRTSGPISDAQCHPFVAAGTTLVMHNGVLSWRSTTELSDTQCFIADHLEPALKKRKGRVSKRFRRELTAKIGSGNKLALWTVGEPKPIIIGEFRGLHHRGRWYSNTYAWTAPDELRTTRRSYVPLNLDDDDAPRWNDEEWVNGMGWLPLLPLARKRKTTNEQRAYAALRKARRKA